ncbi:SWEET3 [Symbiodinium sp. CCMP2456]|nr:SWEET3 [Symbiodinium sp. CCMP2456]
MADERYVDVLLETMAISMAVFFMTSPLSQTLDVYGMPAKVRYVKPLNLLCFYLNCMVQLAYGLYLPVAPLVPCNAYGAAVGVVSTLVCWWFARREAQAEDWDRKAALGTLAIAALSMLAFAYAKYVEGGAEFVGKIGIFVAFSMYGAPLASIGEVVRTQSSETLPLLQSFLGFLNSICWLAVGLRKGATPIWIPNLVSAFLSCIQLALIYKYPVRPEKGAGEQEELILNHVDEPLCQEKESKRQAKVMLQSHCLEEGGPEEPEDYGLPFSI